MPDSDRQLPRGALRRVSGALLQAPQWLTESSAPCAETQIPGDFLGVNVAPADDPGIDDYLLERLAELGLRQVRMDYSYNSPGAPAQRLLERLLDEKYSVLLNVFPPLESARRLHSDSGEQQRWREFLQQVLQQYGGRVHALEIGNTPNRGRWSGFSSRSFVRGWQIASQVCRDIDAPLAGPNVSDFEPLYNAAYLALLEQLKTRLALHTANLFVERVIEPEAFDHRVLGRGATGLLRMNLIKKSRILAAIGRQRAVPDLVCTYTCWTGKRLRRRSAWPAQKQVDYLWRYLVLAASSGALRRVYWGPLVCNRDGLIDDRASDYPKIDQVSFYEKIRGRREDFSPTPAFAALAHAVSVLSAAVLHCIAHDRAGLSLFLVQKEGQPERLIAWCRDSRALPLVSLFSATDLAEARFEDATGQVICAPLVVNEHPLLISWPERDHAAQPHPEAVDPQVAHLSASEYQSLPHHVRDWQGATMLRAARQPQDLAIADRLAPENLQQLPETRVMRDVRNRLWNVADPRGGDGEITVKLNRVKGIKRFSYRFRPSKGRRHWNNACQMLRRGVDTPLPLAYYERGQSPGIRDSWYLCEFIPDAFSCRDVYAAFRKGADSYRGLDKAAWLDLISGFVCHMHNKQVVHRDLSSGNLLLHQDSDGTVRPWLIDIGRAWIWSGPGSRVRHRHRLQDLMRIAYKLDWSDRETFVRRYEAHMGGRLGKGWRIPFHYYDYKQTFKKAIKGKRRKGRGTQA